MNNKFKTLLYKGREVKLVFRNGEIKNDIRVIDEIKGNTIIFLVGGKRSSLEITHMSLVELTNTSLKIFAPGARELTESELTVVKNLPSKRPEYQEMIKRDIMGDTNIAYFLDKKYAYEHGKWLVETSEGKRLLYKGNYLGDFLMSDCKIKGELRLEYSLLSEQK